MTQVLWILRFIYSSNLGTVKATNPRFGLYVMPFFINSSRIGAACFTVSPSTLATTIAVEDVASLLQMTKLYITSIYRIPQIVYGFVLDVLRLSSKLPISGMLSDATARVTHEFVTPRYLATSAPE